MATLQRYPLTNVNDKVEIASPNEEVGGVSLHIPAGAVGTYVVESTINGIDWVALLLTNLNTGTTTAAPAAPGIYQIGTIVANRVRVRKTVGVATELISLTVVDY